MAEKHPTWTRKRIGRDRVHWVAYDDRAGAEGRTTIDQGYATGLVEADAAARAALADAGLYQARRSSSHPARPLAGVAPGPRPGARPPQTRPREYLYTRHRSDLDETTFVSAHLVAKKTPRKVYVTIRSCGPDQLGTEDEAWESNDRLIALDRAKLEGDGSIYSTRFRLSSFYRTREEAMGDASGREPLAYVRLGLRPPCTLEEIKAAYRRKALEVHPDRGGDPGLFQAVEDAYRQLLRSAQGPGGSSPA